MKSKLSLILLLFIVSGCHYKPFVKYKLNREGLRKFSTQEFFVGDNSNVLRNYDVKKYIWNLEVFPKSKQLVGDMTIVFETTEAQTSFIFDFQRHMKITDFETTYGNFRVKRKKDLMYVVFDEKVPKNTKISFKISYKGKPKNIIGEGPIQWKKDKKGRPWISTQTEGLGPHFIMPCNALLKDEPDTTEINITVPKALVVVANGQLKAVVENADTKTYKHLVTNPINIYNISFNIGHFVGFKKRYIDIQGVERFIDCQVLDYNEKIGKEFYDQAPKIMRIYEELYGQFPWWNDGCRFIESTFSAMEHQSGIAMGNDYTYDWKDFNLTLVHELAHEWWGNSVTAYDYCDAWIHEGLATYSEALFLEKMYGKADYNKKILRFYRGTANKIPIKKVCGVLYSSWVSYDDMDIYDKGALMMHSLRILVNDDDLFFGAMHKFQSEMAMKNISSADFITEFNTLLGKDYTALFDLYLNEIHPPILELKLEYFNSQKIINYKWSKPLPFELKNGLTIKVDGESTVIYPTTEFQAVKTGFDVDVKFINPNSIYYLTEIVK